METLFYFMTVGVIYAVLYSIYHLFFRNNTNFQANRIYLLFIVPFAFLLPFINSTVKVASQYQVTLPVFEIGNIATQTTAFNWSNAFIYIYIAISSILLIRLFANLFKTINTISAIKNGGNNNIQPFSFFSFIHVPTNIETEDRLAITHHEEVHSTQLHSLDIIIYEISKVLLWWNPILWMGLNAVKSNHEFIADKLASAKADKYSSVLVAQLLGVNCSVLANNFKSKPLIKKRIMMMKTKKSNHLSVLKYALVIPFVALAIVATTNKKLIAKPINSVAQHTSDKIYDKVDVMPEFKGGTEALMKYLGNNVKYPKEAKENKIEGKVYVAFVIDNNGNIKDVSLAKSANKHLDKEALRVVKIMPKWSPGKKDNKNVSVKTTLPIAFQLQR
jgi:TonB family protein